MDVQIKEYVDKAVMFIEQRNGNIHEVLIDVEDLEKVKEYPGRWRVLKCRDTGAYYVYGCHQRKNIALHRYLIGAPDGTYVDHENHNTLDNRKQNLRIATASENLQNRKGAARHSKSGIRGVYWHERDKCWRARIRLNGREISCGNYKSKEEAEEAVIQARQKYMPFSRN